ncbi:MAG: IS5 family transposase [bacterium]
MAIQTPLPTLWHVPDDFWSLIAPLLGPEKALGTPGRPAVPFRRVFDGILYVLRTGCQWSALPRTEYAPKSTVWGRFPQGAAAGVFQQAWLRVRVYYDLEVGIEWKWQALDGAITKAPLGGEATGPSPVDRAKSGTKRSVLSEGRGAPRAVVAAGANVPDKALALETVDRANGLPPAKGGKRVHPLCLDAGYEYADVIAGMLERDYRLHLKRRREPTLEVPPEKKYPARRWVVERTHAWHNKFRRVLVRWEKKLAHYYAMLDLASTLIVYRLIATADT